MASKLVRNFLNVFVKKAGDTMTGGLITLAGITSGPATGAGTALSVTRDGSQVGLIDNDGGGLRVQAKNGVLKLRGTGDTGMQVDASGKVAFSSGITQAGGMKHKRITTGSVAAGSTVLVTVTWDTAFVDTDYTVSASVIDSTTSSLSLSVVHIESIATTAVTVRVLNNAIGALTGTVHVIAMRG